MKRKLPIIETLIILVVSATVLGCGKATLDKWDSEQWGLMVLGMLATFGAFIVLVALVKHLIGHKDNEDDE